MPPTLLIYMPTYNGSERIQTSLKGVLGAISYLPNELKSNVILHINNNASTDNTLEICTEIRKNSNINFHLASNEVNIGLHKNICRGIELDYQQDLTWIIGDDDILAPNAIVRLYSLIEQLQIKHNIELIDLIHVNYCAIDIKTFYLPNIFDLIQKNKINGWLSNKKHKQPTLCKISDLVDPQIEVSTLGSTMNFVFNSRKVRNKLSDIVVDVEINWDQEGTMSALRAFPLAYLLIHTFNQLTNCLADSVVSVYVAVGHQEWTPMRDKILGIGIVNLLLEMKNLDLITQEHLFYALQGTVKICEKEFQNILFSSLFEELDNNYKDTLLKSFFWKNK